MQAAGGWLRGRGRAVAVVSAEATPLQMEKKDLQQEGEGKRAV